MTYSIIGRCRRTGVFGGAVATSSLAVGNRCLHLRHGAGAFLSQHRTDPRLGERGVAELAAGRSAAAAMAAVAVGPGIGWRQLAALDATGGAAVHHGDLIYSLATDAAGPDHVAIGNILANDGVTAAMSDAFAASADDGLERRLLAALAAGRDAGGEVLGPVRSAALRVTGADGMDRIDLRVDRADEAVAALGELLAVYGDQEDMLRRVAFTPDAVPVSRAMFEASLARIADLGLEDRFPTARRRERWRLTE